MIALARLVVIGFVVLTIIFVCLSFYSKAVRREKLEAKWDASGGPGGRDEYVRAGLEEYSGSLKRKLIWGVYVVPTLIVVAIIYFTNFA